MFTQQSSSFYKNILSISTFGTNGLNKLSESINKLQKGAYLKTSETSNNPCVSCSPARMHKPQAPAPSSKVMLQTKPSDSGGSIAIKIATTIVLVSQHDLNPRISSIIQVTCAFTTLGSGRELRNVSHHVQ